GGSGTAGGTRGPGGRKDSWSRLLHLGGPVGGTADHGQHLLIQSRGVRDGLGILTQDGQPGQGVPVQIEGRRGCLKKGGGAVHGGQRSAPQPQQGPSSMASGRATLARMDVKPSGSLPTVT